MRQEADLSDAWLDMNKITDVMNHVGGLDDAKMMYQMEMHLALREAGLDWKRLWTSLAKLDCTQKGKVRLNEAMECLVRAKRDVDGLDVAAARGTFRRLTRKSRAIDYMSEDLGNAIKSVLHRFTEKGTVEELRDIRDALLERRNYLADHLEINLDTMPKDLKTFKLLLRSASFMRGDVDPASPARDHFDANGDKIQMSMTPSSPMVRFESSRATLSRQAASEESRRNIFAME